MEYKAWCMFSAVQTDTTESYRARLNVLASKMLIGCEYAYLAKTPTHLIIKPLKEKWKATEDKQAMHFYWEGNAAVISLTNLVRQEGAIDKDFFGKRYKVKRSKEGWVCICLQEPI
jgi:hypothetical protein